VSMKYWIVEETYESSDFYYTAQHDRLPRNFALFYDAVELPAGFQERFKAVQREARECQEILRQLHEQSRKSETEVGRL
jgi:hypothetical protein